MTKKSITVIKQRDGSISMKARGAGVDLRKIVTALAGNKKCRESDHRYEPGSFEVCRRCGGEKP